MLLLLGLSACDDGGPADTAACKGCDDTDDLDTDETDTDDSAVDDTADKARAFMTEYKMNYPVLLGLGREDVQDAYGPIWGIPASFLISKDGKVCKRHMGIAPKETFEQEIKALL